MIAISIFNHQWQYRRFYEEYHTTIKGYIEARLSVLWYFGTPVPLENARFSSCNIRPKKHLRTTERISNPLVVNMSNPVIRRHPKCGHCRVKTSICQSMDNLFLFACNDSVGCCKPDTMHYRLCAGIRPLANYLFR